MVGSKQQVVLIHGGSAYSQREAFLEVLRTRTPRDLPGEPVLVKWSSSFKDDLGEEYTVFQPSMPNSQNARYEEWKIWFERYAEYFLDDIHLVGWSLGGSFLVKYLTENEFPVKINQLHLLAAPYDFSGFGPEDGADFLFNAESLSFLQNQVKYITIWHSEDDHVVPYEHALKYKTGLPKAELVTFSDKNHFLIATFPELIEKIKAKNIK